MQSGKVILVVDDNLENRKLIGVFLKALPFSIIEASDALKALAYLEKNKVDLVLLDLSMPLMSGIELCKILRADRRFADLVIIAYTAHAMIDEKQSILDEGFNDLLVKPITRSELTAAISRYV